MPQSRIIEKRFLTAPIKLLTADQRAVDPISVRAGQENEGAEIVGYGAVFNQRTTIQSWWYDFDEEIAPGAFTRALKEKQDVRSFFNHDMNILLANTRNGSLELKEDDTGLFTVIKASNAVRSQDVVEYVRRGDVSGMSFMFTVREDKWRNAPRNSKENDLRTILEIDQLYEVGPVVFPAYEQTSAYLRANSEILIQGRHKLYGDETRYARDEDGNLIHPNATASRATAPVMVPGADLRNSSDPDEKEEIVTKEAGTEEEKPQEVPEDAETPANPESTEAETEANGEDLAKLEAKMSELSLKARARRLKK